MASISGGPAIEPTLTGNAEADLKTAAPKVPQHRGRSSATVGPRAQPLARRVVDRVVGSGRGWGAATRAVLLRNQGRHLRLPRRAVPARGHRRRRRVKVESPVLLYVDRLPGVVRPRQVALVLPSRREHRPKRHVGRYVVDVDLRRTARGALAFLTLSVIAVVLGVGLTFGAVAALVWLYQTWVRPSLTLGG